MPRRMNVGRQDLSRELSEEGDLAIFEDDKTYMTMRVDRLDTGWHGPKTRLRGRGTSWAIWWLSPCQAET